jgi:hypothetical protein
VLPAAPSNSMQGRICNMSTDFLLTERPPEGACPSFKTSSCFEPLAGHVLVHNNVLLRLRCFIGGLLTVSQCPVGTP